MTGWELIEDQAAAGDVPVVFAFGLASAVFVAALECECAAS
jgi:hypothetical protein